MMLSLVLPKFTGDNGRCTLQALFVNEGAEIKPGSPLCEILYDLSGVAPQDCPPISVYKVVSRERGFVRRVLARVGEVLEHGAAIAEVTTDSAEPLEAQPKRNLRVTSFVPTVTADPIFG